MFWTTLRYHDRLVGQSTAIDTIFSAVCVPIGRIWRQKHRCPTLHMLRWDGAGAAFVPNGPRAAGEQVRSWNDCLTSRYGQVKGVKGSHPVSGQPEREEEGCLQTTGPVSETQKVRDAGGRRH